jgi:two-component system alkaline phosphatase synthesis response regulator PhoP
VPKILVVDDESALRSLLVAVLEEEGYAVVQAQNGRAAVELAARERPDLILMDVMMPELGGPGAAQRLREMPDLADVPVVLMSAGGDVNGQVPGVAAFVPKPFDLDDVLAIVRRALKRAT